MRYDHFYPFQQAATFRTPPIPSRNPIPMNSGFHPFHTFGQIAKQLPTNAPINPTSKLDSFLQTADKLFTTAQNYTPYIQQAVPMVKNLPSLYRMYKGFQNLPDAQTQTPRRTNTTTNRSHRREYQEATDYTTKPSKPRIFQPPFD